MRSIPPVFHRHLRRREIYAEASSRWRDPRAQLLTGEEWERKKGPALTDLQLREDPDALLAEQGRALDAALRDVAAQVSPAPSTPRWTTRVGCTSPG